MAKDNVQERCEKQAKYGFEADFKKLLDGIVAPNNCKFSYTCGTVGSSDEMTEEDHAKAVGMVDFVLYWEGNISSEVEYVNKFLYDPLKCKVNIALKETMHNKDNVNIPKRVWNNMGHTYQYAQQHLLILDYHEIIKMFNTKDHTYIIYRDSNNMENGATVPAYYIYTLDDIIRCKASDVYLEPEGGKVGVKRKLLITKDTTRFLTVQKALQYIVDNTAKKDINENKNKIFELFEYPDELILVPPSPRKDPEATHREVVICKKTRA